jgi:hypothetical protein
MNLLSKFQSNRAERPAGQVIVTIDTEAQPARAAGDHVKKLIIGDYGDDNFGILRMMDIADANGIKLVFFFDYAEYDLWGEELLDAAREIDRRGHDLQLHIHPEFISAERFAKFGAERKVKFADMQDQVAGRLVDYILDLHGQCTKKKARAFRGGGYRFSSSILKALHERGIYYASNDNAFYDQGRLPSVPRSTFQWDNGIVEFPVSTIEGFLGLNGTRPYYFDMACLSRPKFTREICVERHGKFVDQYLGDFPDSFAVMVLHSWSFCDKSEEGYRTIPNPESAERFDAVLQTLTRTHEFTTFKQLAHKKYGLHRADDLGSPVALLAP